MSLVTDIMTRIDAALRDLSGIGPDPSKFNHKDILDLLRLQKEILSGRELVGISEISQIARVSKQCVVSWHGRRDHNGFPDPIVRLASGPIFLRKDVVIWLNNNRKVTTITLT